MTIRFRTIFLTAGFLAILSSCATTAPVAEPVVVPEPPSQEDIRNEEPLDKQGIMLKDPAERSLSEIITLSSSMVAYQPDVSVEILRSLESISSSQLSEMIDGQTEGPEFTEWLELALLMRTTLINRSSVPAAARYWAEAHDGHAISRMQFTDLAARYKALFSAPSQVAILLPAEGGLSAAAKAIRDGIMSAYLDDPGNSAIRFYSSGENSQSAIGAYQQARLDGATQIVGPLRIDSTRALASLDTLDVPVLLLNEAFLDDSSGSNTSTHVNSLSLSQTEDAAAIADLALAQGLSRAILIVPDNNWGKRIETAFTNGFESGGGLISASTHFNTTAGDNNVRITQLLEIDKSNKRKADLQSRLGVPLSFEPSRRDDFDFIFLAADHVQGREFKPLLRFHNTADIPVYAMGRIFSGRDNPASDQDLNGIVFPLTPWQLQAVDTTAKTPSSLRDGDFGNLYALGQDAWQLLPWLDLMQKDADLWFPGNVGALRLLANGRIYRKPVWAQFSGGRPVSYQWSDHH